MIVLGLGGAVGHDPAAAIVVDGKVVAAAEEERFNRNKHSKGLQAELATLRLDVPPLLEAESVDLAKVKQEFLAITAKEADLHLAHVTAIQEIRKVLTPEQQQQFKTLQGRMMHEGGRREHRERD